MQVVVSNLVVPFYAILVINMKCVRVIYHKANLLDYYSETMRWVQIVVPTIEMALKMWF